MNKAERVRLYRFGDMVALNTGDNHGYAPTFYITPEMAEALSSLLLDAAEDCRVHPFTVSRLGTVIAKADGTTEKE